ncbi:MAG TPA: T9SS type A sorting domain-containing protein [Chitinophagaceae bacterium]|nr:T9SS type A sorting domain-containing protein [Chitinophagaceae bacterium]
MKTIVPRQKTFHALLVCTTALLLCTAGSTFAGETTTHPWSGIGDTIVISKSQSSKKHKIRLYTNAEKRVLFFSASGENGRVYQLFVFDMEGKLQKQIQVRNKETTVLTNIVKGDYLFEVFSDDERIENGQLVVR